jgi:hypothetical protein
VVRKSPLFATARVYYLKQMQNVLVNRLKLGKRSNKSVQQLGESARIRMPMIILYKIISLPVKTKYLTIHEKTAGNLNNH